MDSLARRISAAKGVDHVFGVSDRQPVALKLDT
jgi:hypothetical protein